MKHLRETKFVQNSTTGKYFFSVLLKMVIAFLILAIVSSISEFKGLVNFSDVTEMALFDLILSFSLSTFVLFLYVRLVEKRKFVTLGFYKGGVLKKYGLGFLTGFVMLSLVVGIAYLMGGIEIALAPSYNSFFGLFLLFLIGFVIQGGVEEIFIRGYLLPSFIKKYGVTVGVIVTSVFFAVLHGMNPGVTFIAIFNLVLFATFAALYALNAGSIWGIMAWHSAWNFTQGNIFGIEVSGNAIEGGAILSTNTINGMDLISGGSFGIEGSIITTIVLLLASFYYLWKLLKKEKHDA